MSARPSQAMTQCSNCGANIAGQEGNCPACGAPLSPSPISLDAQQAALRQLVESSNEDLASSGARAAEMAFGIGCSLGVMISAVLVLATFLIGGRDWTTLAIVAAAGILISTGVSALLATRAKSATIDGTYERVVRPEIDRFVKANRLSRPEFDRMAGELVPEDAPLRSYLVIPPQPEQNEALPEA